MNLEAQAAPRVICPRCSGPLEENLSRTAVWQKDRLTVVEGIPALVCWECGDQYYDDDVSEALRRLNEDGFPEEEAVRTELIHVFTLEGRIRQRVQLPEDTYVD